MGGFDDHAGVTGEWMMPPSPSPRSLFSSMISDDAQSIEENKSEPGNYDPTDQVQAGVLNYETQKSSGGGLMVRLAARTGFNAPRLNTYNIRPSSTDLSKNQEVQLPLFTIPPGLSPTTLLDSPVFLSNSMVLPSPTTGKISFAPNRNYQNSTLMTEFWDKGEDNTFDDVKASQFAFKPVAESGSFLHFNAPNRSNPSGFPQMGSTTDLGFSVHSDTSLLRQSMEPPTVNSENNFQQGNLSKSYPENTGIGNLSSGQAYNSMYVANHSPPLDERQEDDGDRRSGGTPVEDGYNWRKYGQKQVKGSEFPRSYYKCTHLNCPVKKKVERSQEGDITEIIYKGAHNHPKPTPTRRSSLDQDWSQENLEATSTGPLGQEYGNGLGQPELTDGMNVSSTFSNDEDDDEQVTHGSVSLGGDGEEDELESKRRKIETYAASDVSGATRAIREARVVVQTTSEVDILDDGYRWRKYGQKVVKGNPNPRSYYKCTSNGCNVRKHVERASHDLQSVITTYEGKHNHDVPAARNSSHVNSGALPPNIQAPAVATSSHLQRPQPSQVQARFERPSMGSFSMPGRPQMGPSHGFGFGLNQAALASLGMAGFGPNQGRLPPALPVHHPYLGNRAHPMSDMGFMMPKGEPKLEPVTESGLNNSSNSSSVYQQVMGRFPLGPPQM